MRVLYPDRRRNAIICTKSKRELLVCSHFMSELLHVNHIFKVPLPCGRGCAAAVELVRTSCYNNNKVAVPRRGASCYGKNAKNTMQIFGILTIFLYYLLYFCVSIRDIVGFPRCEPACNNLIYCYYNTRFAPNQPVPKPSSIATGCKTRWHKL